MPALDQKQAQLRLYRRLFFGQMLVIFCCVPLGRPAQRSLTWLLQAFPTQCRITMVALGAALIGLLLVQVRRAAPPLAAFLCSAAAAISILAFCCNFVVEPIEWTHLLLYGALAFFASQWLGPVRSASLRAYMRVMAAACLVSLGDETLQAIHPQRVFDLRDLLLNLCGATLGVAYSINLGLKQSDLRSPNNLFKILD